jgi:RNA polymerase sigma-70 factor (ECF subfamily)
MNANSLAKCGMNYLPDDRLLAEAKSGDRQAFGELCLRYTGMLRQRILRIVRHPEDAEDVLQETFLKAYQHLQSFRGAGSFSSWLLAIGTNASLMLLLRRKVLRKSASDVVARAWRDTCHDIQGSRARS